MKKILFLMVTCLTMYCVQGIAQTDSTAQPAAPKKGMVPRYNGNSTAPPPPQPQAPGMSPNYRPGADRGDAIVKMAPNHLASDENNILLRNYANLPLVLCVSANANATCKCLTVSGGKQVTLKLNPDENGRVVKVFNGKAITKYKVYPGNSYGFKYDAGKKKWAYMDIW